jgi:hypothetical protein
MSLRRIPTLLAVALVAAVGVAALVDAVRTGEPAPAGSPEPAGTEPDLAREAERLRAAGAVGVLVVSRPDCRVDLLSMPDLAATPIELCARLGQSGHVVTLDGRLPSPADNLSVASCADEGVVLQRADVTYSLPGCQPTWRPDGLLTIVHEGELRGVRPPDLRLRRLLSSAELRRLLEQALPPADTRSLEVTEAAWLSDTRLVAILRREREPPYLVAVLERRRLLPWRCCFEDLRSLRVSPARTFVDVESEQGVLVFHRSGGFFPVGVVDGRPADAVAWSPGDRFIAVARAGSILVLEPEEEGLVQVARLPIEAADVRWANSARDVLFPEGTN